MAIGFSGFLQGLMKLVYVKECVNDQVGLHECIHPASAFLEPADGCVDGYFRIMTEMTHEASSLVCVAQLGLAVHLLLPVHASDFPYTFSQDVIQGVI